MATIHPGSAHFFRPVLLNGAHTIPDKNCKIYDCFIPCTWAGINGQYINCSLCHQDFTAAPAVQAGVYNVHMKVCMHVDDHDTV